MRVYDLPTESAQVGGMPQVQGFDVSGPKDVSGAQLQEMGAANTKGALALADIAQKIENTAAEAVTRDGVVMAENSVRDILYHPETGLARLSGKEAVDEGLKALKKLEEIKESVRKTAQSPLARDLLAPHLERIIGSARTHVMGNTVNHLKVWNTESADNRVESAMRGVGDVLQTGMDSKIFSDAIMEFRAAVKDYARISGTTEEAVTIKYGTVLHATNIQRLVTAENSEGAKEYYDKFKAEIDYKLHDALTAKITEGLDYQHGQAAGSSVFETYMDGVSINDTVPKSDMIADIEDNKKLSNRGKKYAIQKMEFLLNKRDDQLTLNARGLSNTVVGQATNDNDRGQYNQLLRAINNQDGVTNEAKGHLRDWLNHKYHVSEDRALAKNLGPLTAFFKLQQTYGQPGSAKLTPQDILQQAHVYGAFTDNAATYIAHANAQATVVSLTRTTLEDYLRRMSASPLYKEWLDYIPRVDRPTEDDKAKMALLQARVVGLVSASGEAGGPGGKMSIEKALDIALRPASIPGALFGTKKIPSYLLGTVESKNPKEWPSATQVSFIDTDFYIRHHRFPTSAERDALMKALNK